MQNLFSKNSPLCYLEHKFKHYEFDYCTLMEVNFIIKFKICVVCDATLIDLILINRFGGMLYHTFNSHHPILIKFQFRNF